MPSSGTTSVVPLDWQSKMTRGRGTLALSTNADGFTGGQIADMGGLSLCAVMPSTLSSDAQYGFRGGHTTDKMGTVRTSTGAVFVVGSSAAGLSPGSVIVFDPAPFAGLRFIQPITATSGVGMPASTGATIDIFGAGVNNRIL